MILTIDTERAKAEGFVLMKQECSAYGCMRVPAKWEELPEGMCGEWIIEKDKYGTKGICSSCGMVQRAGELNYCPECGMKMTRKSLPEPPKEE